MNLHGVAVPEIVTQQSVEELRSKLFTTLDGLTEPVRVFFGGAPVSVARVSKYFHANSLA